MYIVEAKIKLKQLKLENNNKNVEAYMTKADVLLIQIGMPYREHNYLTNGARADALFKTLSSWLVIKIKESPSPCHHSQWYFGRVAEAARRILTARASVPSQFKEKETKKDTTSTYKGNNSYQKKPWNKDNKDKPKYQKSDSEKGTKKTFKKMLDQEREHRKKNNLCFKCAKTGHSSQEYRDT